MRPIGGSARARLTLAWTVKFGIHVSLLFLGLVFAYQLRRPVSPEWWWTDQDAVRVVGWAALYAAIGAGVELVFQSERSAWRFASMREVVGLVRNVTITNLLFLGLIFFIDRGFQLPRSVLPLTWLVSLALLVGFRMVWRLPHDPALASHFLPSWWRGVQTDRTPTLIVGPMASADRQLRMLQGDPTGKYQPVAVITPNEDEVGVRLHGVPFIGDVATWAQGQSAALQLSSPHAIVFLDDPVQVYGLSTERIGELRRSGHALLKPQSLAELDGGTLGAGRLEEIPLEDFLPRKPINLDVGPVRKLVAGKRVLVTGAGGSIGSELCRQLVSFGCARLSMVDHSEFLLFEIDRELAAIGSAADRCAIIANVRDGARMQEIMRTERPAIVFHAAALKHVALVENNPEEGVLTNVLGTWNVIQAAVTHGVDQFVLISTDKAVAPTNVMGATKRIAETLLDLVQGHATQLTAVRFGNVLGSAGSVVPIFRRQIASGGPVTVTDPEVNRFFMTIPEAVQLVLNSAAIGVTGSNLAPRKFLLEMGESVKIVDLARQMIELNGQVPDVDIKIEFTGLKPGEKLAEVLSDDGEEVHQCVDGIMELRWKNVADDVRLSEVLALAQVSNDVRDPIGARVLAIVDAIRAAQTRGAGV